MISTHKLARVIRNLLSIVASMSTIANREHIVQLLERQPFGFRQQEICIDGSEDVPASIPRKGTLWSKSFQESWPGK